MAPAATTASSSTSASAAPGQASASGSAAGPALTPKGKQGRPSSASTSMETTSTPAGATNNYSMPISAPSPGIATGEPWTHPPNYSQFPPPVAAPSALELTRKGSRSSPTDESGASGSRLKGIGKAPQTVADAVAASVGNKKERKRKRIHYSCAECHRRKHKCDRQYPCGPCLERGIGDSCRPFESGDEHGDHRDRIARLEDIVEALATAQTSLARELTEARQAGLLPGSSKDATTATAAAGSSANTALSVPAIADDEDDNSRNKRLRPPSMRGMEREELFHAERRTEGIDEDEDGRRVPGSALERNGNPLEGGLTTEGDAFFGALALPSVSRGAVETEINGQRLELGAHLPRFPASFKIARLVSEGGAAPNVVAELMELLPPKSVTDGLLHLYFRDINNTRLPIHEGTFRQSYDALMSFKWGKAREEVGDDGARHVPFLAFLFILLAIAKRNEPESMTSEDEAKKGAMKLYHACRKTIHVATYIRADHIDLVLAQTFAARYLITCRQSAESWSMLGSAIRAAQAIGLHRDGSKLGLDASTTERRRRLWSLLFYLDKSTSILLGRPPAIQNHHCDTMAPSDVDIDTMPRTAVAGPPKWADPGSPPGVFNFVAIRHALTIITGKIAEHFQDLSRPRSYSDVIALDEELESFKASLPAPYKAQESQGMDKSFDTVCPWLPLHRYLISVEYHYIRCTLHRPYLLRNSEKYALSRNAAFASAREDRRVRQEYKRDVQWPKDRARKRHMGGLYRLFSSTLITGIELLLDPTGEDAEELMACLDEFIEKHNRRAEKDQCSKREVAIIELFRQKAKDPSWCARKGAKKATVAAGGQPSRSGARTQPGDGSADSQQGTAGQSGGPFARMMDSPAPGSSAAAGKHGASASGSSGSGSVTTPHGGALLPSASSIPSFNPQELAQSIFDTLGGGMDQFNLTSALQQQNKGRSTGAAGADGTNPFGGIAGPGMALPEDLSGIGANGAGGNFYDSLWGGGAGGGEYSGALTPAMNGGAVSGSNQPWANSSAFTNSGAGGSAASQVAGASPASSGGGGNLSNMDWSADSLMPWGAMIEAIAMQKPGQGGNGGNGDGSNS
ncbi:hypothetical protein BDZ90DRAFT_248479 [Jaminaea rosea]|uniref:Zn(2)-C6 fungal-type domain-containing protein n=1 Tax=Jaminaea rosea TaxID=1569628 RepID=A0A316V3R8_9BASI|nr:hypothetical protein BDZ90DRAFT_248479 [Jaminaea rosea]PWN30843.1 hypothetical protein BDZ90DRAFT_248479 [Jaminaea rosea]